MQVLIDFGWLLCVLLVYVGLVSSGCVREIILVLLLVRMCLVIFGMLIWLVVISGMCMCGLSLVVILVKVLCGIEVVIVGMCVLCQLMFELIRVVLVVLIVCVCCMIFFQLLLLFIRFISDSWQMMMKFGLYVLWMWCMIFIVKCMCCVVLLFQWLVCWLVCGVMNLLIRQFFDFIIFMLLQLVLWVSCVLCV